MPLYPPTEKRHGNRLVTNMMVQKYPRVCTNSWIAKRDKYKIKIPYNFNKLVLKVQKSIFIMLDGDSVLEVTS